MKLAEWLVNKGYSVAVVGGPADPVPAGEDLGEHRGLRQPERPQDLQRPDKIDVGRVAGEDLEVGRAVQAVLCVD